MPSFQLEIIAPCGMNCGTCYAYLREKNKCGGCRIEENLPYHCSKCVIKNCKLLAETTSNFCYDCRQYPCQRLKRLDKRYIQNYGISLLGNLRNIQLSGLVKHVEEEKERWKCDHCGSIVCVHHGACSSCNMKK